MTPFESVGAPALGLMSISRRAGQSDGGATGGPGGWGGLAVVVLAGGQLAVAVAVAVAVVVAEGTTVGFAVGSPVGADADAGGFGEESFSVDRDCPPHATANARHEPASAGAREPREVATRYSVRQRRGWLTK